MRLSAAFNCLMAACAGRLDPETPLHVLAQAVGSGTRPLSAGGPWLRGAHLCGHRCSRQARAWLQLSPRSLTPPHCSASGHHHSSSHEAPPTPLSGASGSTT